MTTLTGRDLRVGHVSERISGQNLQYADPTPEQRGFLVPLMIPRGSSQAELAVPSILYEPYHAFRRLWAGDYTRDEAGPLALQAAGLAAPGALVSRPANALASGMARPASGLADDIASRFARAKEAGFNTDERLYHGTARSFEAFSFRNRLKHSEDAGESAVWLTPDPQVAGGFADYLARLDRGTNTPGYERGARILPVYARGKEKVIDAEYLAREYADEFARRLAEDPDYVSPIGNGPSIMYDPHIFGNEMRRARAEGYHRVRFVKVEEGMGDSPADQIAVFAPSDVRSTNAKFDPKTTRSRNLLSAHPAASLPGAMSNDGEWSR